MICSIASLNDLPNEGLVTANTEDLRDQKTQAVTGTENLRNVARNGSPLDQKPSHNLCQRIL